MRRSESASLRLAHPCCRLHGDLNFIEQSDEMTATPPYTNVTWRSVIAASVSMLSVYVLIYLVIPDKDELIRGTECFISWLGFFLFLLIVAIISNGMESGEFGVFGLFVIPAFISHIVTPIATVRWVESLYPRISSAPRSVVIASAFAATYVADLVMLFLTCLIARHAYSEWCKEQRSITEQQQRNAEKAHQAEQAMEDERKRREKAAQREAAAKAHAEHLVEFQNKRETIVDFYLENARLLQGESGTVTLEEFLKSCGEYETRLNSDPDQWGVTRSWLSHEHFYFARTASRAVAKEKYSSVKDVVCDVLREDVFVTLLEQAVPSEFFGAPEEPPFQETERRLARVLDRIDTVYRDRLPTWQENRSELRLVAYEDAFAENDDHGQEFPFEDEPPPSAEEDAC